jgi:hypothetical protein
MESIKLCLALGHHGTTAYPSREDHSHGQPDVVSSDRIHMRILTMGLGLCAVHSQVFATDYLHTSVHNLPGGLNPMTFALMHLWDKVGPGTSEIGS